MSGHDEFRELGALAAIGQITAAENESLAAHLRECPECGEAYADYSRILRQELPQADPTRFRGRQKSLHPATDEELRERFFARARAHGADFSSEVEQRIAVARKQSPRLPMWWALAAVAAVLVIAAGMALSLGLRRRQAMPVSASQAPQDELVRKELDEATRKIAALNDEISTQSVKNGDLANTLRDREARLAEARSSLDRLNADLAQTRSASADLAATRDHDQAVIAGLNEQIQTLQDSNATSIAAIVELQDKITALKAGSQRQAERLEMERQLATVSSDVRKLMGARNLHIIDVHDVNGEGRSAKSFGRVFYAEGQSLVFYAFDLPNRKLTPAKYNFQAWGQQEGEAQSVRSLGTFSVDDREQHRWVLKVSDASLLKGIDSVFVTAEKVGDGDSPRGKRLLYAYLAPRPNHP